MVRDGRVWRQILAWTGFVMAVGAPAAAHDPFEITTEANLRGEDLYVEVTIARSTALWACSPEKPTALSFKPEDFPTLKPMFDACAAKLYDVADAGKPLKLDQYTVELTVENDLVWKLHYPRPKKGPLRFTATHIQRLPPEGFGASLSVEVKRGIVPAMKLLRHEDPTLEVPLTGGGVSSGQTFKEFLVLGVEHILTGYDHLLFLAGLLVACRRFATMALIITCFTIAHSVTLGLAALDVFSLPGRVVEPLIAASILFVGVENLVRQGEPAGRWALTLAFGLIHGFGFAGVLKEIGLGSAGVGLILPLFSFNLGVELGQIAVALLVLPLLLRISDREAFVRYGRPALSVAVAVAGGYWLVTRLTDA